MKETCLKCHTTGPIDQFYKQAEARRRRRPTRASRRRRRSSTGSRGGKARPTTPFDEPIEYLYFDLWHYDGRTAKHGAFMGGADFVQWHGAYQLNAKLTELKAAAAEIDARGAEGDRPEARRPPHADGSGSGVASPARGLGRALRDRKLRVPRGRHRPGAFRQRVRARGRSGFPSSSRSPRRSCSRSASCPRCARGPVGSAWSSARVRGASASRGCSGTSTVISSASRRLKNLVYAAPFAAPLAYTGLGLLVLLGRLVDSGVRGLGCLGRRPRARRLRRELRALRRGPRPERVLPPDGVDRGGRGGVRDRVPVRRGVRRSEPELPAALPRDPRRRSGGRRPRFFAAPARKPARTGRLGGSAIPLRRPDLRAAALHESRSARGNWNRRVVRGPGGSVGAENRDELVGQKLGRDPRVTELARQASETSDGFESGRSSGRS